MTKFILTFLLAVSANAITVSDIAFDGGSHSIVGVRFTVDARPQSAHIRYIASPGTCTSGSGGYVVGNGFGFSDFSIAGENPGYIRLDVGGLAPATAYQFCPEVYDGSKWSSGVGAIFTTAKLPAIHPEPPIPPVKLDTNYPDTTGFTRVSVGANCQSPSLQALYLSAIANQMNNGTVILIPAGTVCDGPIGSDVARDLTYFNHTGVDIATGTIMTQSPHGLKDGDRIVGLDFTGYGQKLPWTWQQGYVYYVHVVDSTHFRISYPNFDSAIQTFLDQGSGSPAYYKYPRLLKPIIIRTSTPDSQLPPENTRINPAWSSKMATIRNNTPGPDLTKSVAFTYKRTSDWDANVQTAIGNIRFVGIRFSTGDTAIDTTDPIAYHGYLQTTTSDGPITIDRCIFTHGDGPARINNAIGFDGHMMTIKDSYFDDLNFWHNTAVGFGIGSDNNHSIKMDPGTFRSGTLTYKMPSQLTITWTGKASGNMEGGIYADMNGVLTVACPAGVKCSTTQAAKVVTADPGANSNCDRSDPVFPRNGDGRVAAAYLGCFYVNSNGALNRGQGSNPSVADAPEGAQIFLAGSGPGPYLLQNNYASGSGNWFHFDNAGYGLDRGDYVVRRNHFHFDMKHCYGGNQAYAGRNPESDGLSYLHRWFLEWKGGNRAKIEGNFFDGSCADVETTGSLFHVVARDWGNVSDFDFTNNVFAHAGSLGAVAGPIDSHTNPMSLPSPRMRFKNNLAFDIDGWHYCAYESLAYQGGTGWYLQGASGIEDLEIDHNTFLPNIGLVPHIMDGPTSPVEGFKFTNNILSYSGTVGGGGTGFRSGGTAMYPGDAVPNCGSLQDKAFLDCIYTSGPGHTSYQFSGNVIYPGFGPSYNYPGTGRVDPNWLSGQFAGLANNTIASYGSDVKSLIDSLGFFDATAGDYRLKASSPLLSGARMLQSVTTDRKNAGADMNELMAAMGTVQGAGVSMITPTSAVIQFVAPDAQACPVDYAPFNPQDPNLMEYTRASDLGGTRSRAVKLDGLQSHMVYEYRVNCATMQPSGQFVTP